MGGTRTERFLYPRRRYHQAIRLSRGLYNLDQGNKFGPEGHKMEMGGSLVDYTSYQSFESFPKFPATKVD